VSEKKDSGELSKGNLLSAQGALFSFVLIPFEESDKHHTHYFCVLVSLTNLRCILSTLKFKHGILAESLLKTAIFCKPQKCTVAAARPAKKSQ